MAERYKRLFSLPKNIYSAGSPVVIAAGALLLDNTNDKIIAQLKFKSISSKAIKSLRVSILPLDSVNRTLGEPVLHEYLDLAVNRDDEFGQKEAVFLPNPSTRAFSVTVVEVAFADNNVWTPEDDNWQPMPVPVAIDDKELLKQYQYRFGEDAKQLAVTVPGAWVCACGGINTDKENKCHKCGKKLGVLLACDMDELAAEKNKRLALERENRIKAEDAEREKRNRRRKRTKQTVSTILTLFFICALLSGAVVLFKDNMVKKANEASNADAGSQVDDISVAAEIPVRDIMVGDSVLIGKFEQDNVASNGPEPIEWVVLAKDNDKILLISKYVLDFQQFNPVNVTTSWSLSPIRERLNGYFLDSCFTPKEKESILSTSVSTYEMSATGELALNETQDRLFLLGVEECESYFVSDESRKCSPTKYAETRTNASYSSGYCAWWLRSPAVVGVNHVAFCSGNGTVNKVGDLVLSTIMGVRPAMWVVSEHLELENVIKEESSPSNTSHVDVAEEGPVLLDSLQKVQIGDRVTFGTYEQDHNAENGEEKIEWTVLDREEDSILLLSTYGLEEKPFDNVTTRSNWPNCELRAWLNGVFFKKAFSYEEQNYVKVVTLENDNLSHPTEDKVFLLSKSEVTKYFPNDSDRICISAYLHAIHSDRVHLKCWWWLRSPNKDLDKTMVVLPEGRVLEGGFNPGTSEYVRPAVWVKTKLDEDVQTNNPVNSEKPVPSANISNKPSSSSGSSSSGSSSFSYGSTSGSYIGKDRSKDAWVCAKKYVEDNLKSPSTAEFCKYTDATVMRVGEDEYIIHGYVDAENSFGATVRQTWTVSLFLTEKGFRSPYLEWG